MYSIHTDVMSDVVLENTLDIKCIFYTSRFIKFILFWEFIYFFLLLNYQIIATEKILQFVLKNLFWSMHSCMSRILYL